ncbi:MAG: aminotransferase class V-fold PLP-dependent enzyme [Anaerotignum faecicola]
MYILMPTKYYFDNAATTPVREEVSAGDSSLLQRILRQCIQHLQLIARESKKALEAAKAKVAAAIGATPDGGIYFTAGGSESDNMALRGVVNASKKEKKHIITTKIEHHAILHTAEFLETKGVDVTYLNLERPIWEDFFGGAGKCHPVPKPF